MLLPSRSARTGGSVPLSLQIMRSKAQTSYLADIPTRHDSSWDAASYSKIDQGRSLCIMHHQGRLRLQTNQLEPEPKSQIQTAWIARTGLVHQSQCGHTSSWSFRLFTCQRTRKIRRPSEATTGSFSPPRPSLFSNPSPTGEADHSGVFKAVNASREDFSDSSQLAWLDTNSTWQMIYRHQPTNHSITSYHRVAAAQYRSSCSADSI